VVIYRYLNPRPAEWPEADYVVSNPPFIGNKLMREIFSDEYAETLRKTYSDVPNSVDYVMYWWHKAAELVRFDEICRFGMITTNSLTQIFNRRAVLAQLESKRA
jgi:methylase of polypeptide subunit release factors